MKPVTPNNVSDQLAHKLLQKAKQIVINAFPKTSLHKFGVCLLTKKGSMYEGVSYGSDTATLTMHAEASALNHAAIHGEYEIVAIAGAVHPCHICKQLIYESSLRSGIDTLIIFEEKGDIKQIPISKMMPYPWPEKV